VHAVVSYSKHRDAYYVASKFRARDKLLKVGGVDAITRDKVAARHAGKPKVSGGAGAQEGPQMIAGFEWN